MISDIFVNFIIALFGGLLMNFMPCVLPFISIKISGFIKNSDCRKKFAVNNIVYSLGILAFFIFLATIFIFLKSASQSIMIGSHMQHGSFLLITFFVLLLVGLNLFGLFDLSLSLNSLKLTSFVSKNNWVLKSFFSGFFVSIFAVSCTAPFIVTAITYGLANTSNLMIMMIGMAIGFSLPFLLSVFFFDRIVKILPKSGDWMSKFQKIISLPIFASLLWIIFILSKQNNYFEVGIALNFGFAILSFFIIKSLFFKYFDLKFYRKAGLFFLLGSIAYLFLPISNLEINKFSYDKLMNALSNNKKVMVVASASWCVTCHINEFNVLNKRDFKEKLAKSNIIYMYLDLTNNNEEGSKFLNSYKHVGVPFYILFDSNGHHEILPQVLTKSLVIEKINHLT